MLRVMWLLFCPVTNESQGEREPLRTLTHKPIQTQPFSNLKFVKVVAKQVQPIATSSFFNKRRVFLYVTCAGVLSITLCLIVNPVCPSFFGRFFHLTKNTVVEILIELLADILIFAVITYNTAAIN